MDNYDSFAYLIMLNKDKNRHLLLNRYPPGQKGGITVPGIPFRYDLLEWVEVSAQSYIHMTTGISVLKCTLLSEESQQFYLPKYDKHIECFGFGTEISDPNHVKLSEHFKGNLYVNKAMEEWINFSTDNSGDFGSYIQNAIEVYLDVVDYL